MVVAVQDCVKVLVAEDEYSILRLFEVILG